MEEWTGVMAEADAAVRAPVAMAMPRATPTETIRLPARLGAFREVIMAARYVPF